MRRGLILEGGAMRGLFTAGVLDVMMEADLHYDGIVGVSAGAVFGCNYKSHQPGRVLRYNLRFCRDPRYCSLRSLVKTGDLYGADFCYRQLPDELDWFDAKTFREDPTEFYAVCTDLDTGKPVYHRCMDGGAEDLQWLRASASLPLAAQPVEVKGGQRLLDGGIADSIPLAFFERRGYDRNVVVLTQPLSYRKGRNRLLPLVRATLRRYPATVAAMAERSAMYNRQAAYVRQREREGAAFVLRPEAPLDIGRVEHDPAKLQAVYDQGRAVALRRLDALRAYLADPVPNGGDL